MEVYSENIRGILEPSGFEVNPFQIGWYNEKVDDVFRLPYPDETLAFCIISTPSMFEKVFLPYVERLTNQGTVEKRDPIDSCVAEQLQRARQALPPDCEVDVLQDSEMDPVSRRPKILVQTAGHVAGAAYYYQKGDVQNSPWPESKKIYGGSIHPRFGGWFAFRGAIILKNVTCGDLAPSSPQKLLTTDEAIIDFLERFNFSWKDNTWRDVIEVVERYSDEQIRYFDTPPKKRLALLGLE